MNQTTEHILWPYDKQEVFICSCCGCELSELESADPCEIDGEIFCDEHASNLTQLRLDGFISEVSCKTKLLVEDVWKNHNLLAWQKVYDDTYRNVKHI